MAEDVRASSVSNTSTSLSQDTEAASSSHQLADPSVFRTPGESLPQASDPAEPSTAHAPTNDEADGDGDVDAQANSTEVRLDAQGQAPRRSCVTCRKRKVKCDKLLPCSNCNRAQIPCLFPAPGRARRKTRKQGEGRDKELLERLSRLEGVVKDMGLEVAKDGKSTAGDDQLSEAKTSSYVGKTENGKAYMHAQTPAQKQPRQSQAHDVDEEFHDKTKWLEAQQKGRFEMRFGRLVVNEGKSRYINNSFWASLSNEVEDLKGILNQSSDEEEDYMIASPGSAPYAPTTHQEFVFGYSSQSNTLLRFHPLPSQMREYWDIYKDRVDPLVKVLHIPTLEGTVLSAASHLDNLSRGFECLLFAIYYSATTSLSAHDCLNKLGQDKSILLSRYRFAIEQALARANFLTTEEMVVLQAFVIFLICLRRNSDARVIWTLTGLVVRIAQTIGIHRDGCHFGLSPFEVELRRRLWWQICILDIRASEDHGCDPTIVEQSFDTKMPLNINDGGMTPEMTEFPPEQQGCTVMSFCLLRYEVANTFRRINYIPPGPPKACPEYIRSATLQDKERWITECHNRVEERYLKHCDMSVPLFWVTATVARLMMSKMWLMVYHPFQKHDDGASLSSEVKEKLFITSIENMEYSILLESEARTKKWGWLFRTYIQWHALVFTLSELCTRTTGEMVERAWRAVNKTVDGRWGARLNEETNTGQLWRPLKKLYRKAKDARAREMQERKAAQLHRSDLPLKKYNPNANPMFGSPNRPRLTRAPLSQAQLQRFHQGPAFGHTPLDKHELLRSPRLSELDGNNKIMDTSGLSVDLLGQLLQTESHQLTSNPVPLSIAGSDFSIPPSETAMKAPSTQNLITPAMMMDFGSLPLHPCTTSLSIDSAPTGENNLHMPVVAPPPLEDASVMDTSGNMDWQDWDRLVGQFGMDIDSGANLSDLNLPIERWA